AASHPPQYLVRPDPRAAGVAGTARPPRVRRSDAGSAVCAPSPTTRGPPLERTRERQEPLARASRLCLPERLPERREIEHVQQVLLVRQIRRTDRYAPVLHRRAIRHAQVEQLIPVDARGLPAHESAR